MNTLLFKILVSITVFFTNLLFVFLPSIFSTTNFISKAESLAGGIFVGAAICHLFPEAIHSYGISMYPTPALISLTAILIMWVIDKIAEHSEKTQEIEEETISNKNTINKLPPLQILVLYLTLIFHCFIEGVAFGIVREKKSLWALFFATIGHKPIECMIIAMKLTEKGQISKTVYSIMMFIFCITLPLTVVIFSFVGKSLSNSFCGFVTSFSAGAFLFFGFHELIELAERTTQLNNKNKAIHVSFYLCGIIWMILITTFGEEHQH